MTRRPQCTRSSTEQDSRAVSPTDCWTGRPSRAPRTARWAALCGLSQPGPAHLGPLSGAPRTAPPLGPPGPEPPALTHLSCPFLLTCPCARRTPFLRWGRGSRSVKHVHNTNDGPVGGEGPWPAAWLLCGGAACFPLPALGRGAGVPGACAWGGSVQPWCFCWPVQGLPCSSPRDCEFRDRPAPSARPARTRPDVDS